MVSTVSCQNVEIRSLGQKGSLNATLIYTEDKYCAIVEVTPKYTITVLKWFINIVGICHPCELF